MSKTQDAMCKLDNAKDAESERETKLDNTE